MEIRKKRFNKACNVCKIIEADSKSTNKPTLIPGARKILRHIVAHELLIQLLGILAIILSVIVFIQKMPTSSSLPGYTLGFSALLIVFLGILFEKHYETMYDMSNDPNLKKLTMVDFKRNYVSNSIHMMAIVFLMCTLILAGLLSLYHTNLATKIAVILLLFSAISIALLLVSLAITSTQNVGKRIRDFYEKESKRVKRGGTK